MPRNDSKMGLRAFYWLSGVGHVQIFDSPSAISESMRADAKCSVTAAGIAGIARHRDEAPVRKSCWRVALEIIVSNGLARGILD